MATAMAQTPRDRRTWDDIQIQITKVKDMEQVLGGEMSLEDLHARERDSLQNMLKGMFGENGPSRKEPQKQTDGAAEDRTASLKSNDIPPSARTRPSRRAEGGTTKKEFVEQVMRSDEEASLKDIQIAWQEAGNTDTISSSLVYKTKSELKSKGTIAGGRRGGGDKETQTKGVGKDATASSHVSQSASEDIHAEVRRAAFNILSRPEHGAGLTIADIAEMIEIDELVTVEKGNDLTRILADELKKLREEGKAERGDNRQIRKVDGAELD